MSLRTSLVLALCAGAVRAGPDDARRLQPDHAPTPYTAAQIRAACREGRTSTFLLEPAGRAAARSTYRFARCDEKGCDLEQTRATRQGKAIGGKIVRRTTWKQLQGHASFAQERTKITESDVETPAGKFACMLYTVTTKTPDKTTVQRFHFARKLPGPPVKMTTHVDGKLTFTMTLIEHKDGKAPPEGK